MQDTANAILTHSRKKRHSNSTVEPSSSRLRYCGDTPATGNRDYKIDDQAKDNMIAALKADLSRERKTLKVKEDRIMDQSNQIIQLETCSKNLKVDLKREQGSSKAKSRLIGILNKRADGGTRQHLCIPTLAVPVQVWKPQANNLTYDGNTRNKNSSVISKNVLRLKRK